MPSFPSNMPVWTPEELSTLKAWDQAYEDAIKTVREARKQCGIMYIGTGPCSLTAWFRAHCAPAHPCVELCAGGNLVHLFTTGDPSTTHASLSGYILASVLLCIENPEDREEQLASYTLGTSPSWDLWVRHPGTIGGRTFEPGKNVKEPDAAIFRESDWRPSGCVVEIGWHNESAKEILWECVEWAQRGQAGRTPIAPRNVLAIHVEKRASFVEEGKTFAFAVILLSAWGEAINDNIVLLNSSGRFERKWRRVASESKVAGIPVSTQTQADVPLSFLLRGLPAKCKTRPLILSAQRLEAKCLVAERCDREQEKDAVMWEFNGNGIGIWDLGQAWAAMIK